MNKLDAFAERARRAPSLKRQRPPPTRQQRREKPRRKARASVESTPAKADKAKPEP